MLQLALNVLILAASTGLTPEDQQNVELLLSIIAVVLILLIVGLLGFAYSIRFIARNRTHPCPACMEFIPKTDGVCPRCGKTVVQK
jgi:rRNA maturation endonuclease Nob1